MQIATSRSIKDLVIYSPKLARLQQFIMILFVATTANATDRVIIITPTPINLSDGSVIKSGSLIIDDTKSITDPASIKHAHIQLRKSGASNDSFINIPPDTVKKESWNYVKTADQIGEPNHLSFSIGSDPTWLTTTIPIGSFWIYTYGEAGFWAAWGASYQSLPASFHLVSSGIDSLGSGFITPVPESGTFATLTIGLLLVSRTVRRRRIQVNQ